MRDQIKRLLELYPSARSSTPFGGAHEVQRLFKSLQREVEQLPQVSGNSDLQVTYSYGKGNWASVPWLAILDTRLTSTTMDGTYIVMLLAEDGSGCDLKLAQGVTKLHRALGKKGADQKLREQAEQVRELFPQPEGAGFGVEGDGRLGRVKKMAALYEASTIYSRYFEVADVPSDQQLAGDFEALLGLYKSYADYALTHKEPELESDDDFEGQRIWAVSAGEGGSQWRRFVDKGIAAIGWAGLGALSDYSNRDEITAALKQLSGADGSPSNDSLACYQFCHEMAPGDVVIAKQGRKKILGMGFVRSEYEYLEGDPYPNTRKVEWVRTEGAEWPGSGITSKTLTEMTAYDTVRELVRSYLDLEPAGPVQQEEDGSESGAPYGVGSILSDGSFLTEAQIRELLATLKRKKNLILQGPPGTGKTWLAKRLAFALMGKKDTARLRAVQFHPNLSYEDFVRGWRPAGGSDGRLQLSDGPFMEMVEDARNSAYPHVLVIEEVNRGNPAQIFGELLTLMEADKRTPSEALELSYRRFHGEKVHVPPNLFVIGTMNVADRSLAIVDMALRRRFAFFDMDPLFNDGWRSWLENECDFDPGFVDRIQRKAQELNDAIAADPSLGPQFRIGHSFLSPSANSEVSSPEAWYQQVVDAELAPLIREYWFDNPERAAELITALAL
jgi:hypothetical protein